MLTGWCHASRHPATSCGSSAPARAPQSALCRRACSLLPTSRCVPLATHMRGRHCTSGRSPCSSSQRSPALCQFAHALVSPETPVHEGWGLLAFLGHRHVGVWIRCASSSVYVRTHALLVLEAAFSASQRVLCSAGRPGDMFFVSPYGICMSAHAQLGGAHEDSMRLHVRGSPFYNVRVEPSCNRRLSPAFSMCSAEVTLQLSMHRRLLWQSPAVLAPQ